MLKSFTMTTALTAVVLLNTEKELLLLYQIHAAVHWFICWVSVYLIKGNKTSPLSHCTVYRGHWTWQTTRKDNPLKTLALKLHITSINPGVFLSVLNATCGEKGKALFCSCDGPVQFFMETLGVCTRCSCLVFGSVSYGEHFWHYTYNGYIAGCAMRNA